MKALKETETNEATPEQLLQILSGQLETQRSQRKSGTRNRASILVVGLLFIIAATGAALVVLDQMVTDLRQNGPAASQENAGERTNF
jgi:hypothetical protein